MGSMARSEREGKSRGTMATASCEKSTRPHDASADHSTSHGDDADLRSRWSPVASLLIAASYLLRRRRRPVGSPTIKAAARAGDPAGGSRGTAADLGGVREMGAGAGEGIGGDARRISVDAGGRGRAAAFRRTCAQVKAATVARRNGLRFGEKIKTQFECGNFIFVSKNVEFLFFSCQLGWHRPTRYCRYCSDIFAAVEYSC